MDVEGQGRFQNAVLWTPAGLDSYGQRTYNSPVALLVRWEETREEAINDQGQPIAIDATVIVAQEIAVGSLLWLGALASLPASPTNLMLAQSYNIIPDIKGRRYFRSIKLSRFSNTLPTVV